jgi:hypothetical protein
MFVDETLLQGDGQRNTTGHRLRLHTNLPAVMSYDMHLSRERRICTLLVFKRGKRRTICHVRKTIITATNGWYIYIYIYVYIFINIATYVYGKVEAYITYNNKLNNIQERFIPINKN